MQNTFNAKTLAANHLLTVIKDDVLEEDLVSHHLFGVLDLGSQASKHHLLAVFILGDLNSFIGLTAVPGVFLRDLKLPHQIICSKYHSEEYFQTILDLLRLLVLSLFFVDDELFYFIFSFFNRFFEVFLQLRNQLILFFNFCLLVMLLSLKLFDLLL